MSSSVRSQTAGTALRAGAFPGKGDTGFPKGNATNLESNVPIRPNFGWYGS
jgi:hypothetical protein